MKVTKNQLRRIIHEEYNKLRKAKLIKEAPFDQMPGYAKNKQVDLQSQITLPENADLREKIIVLIQTAYAYLKGGNFDYKQADDLQGKNYDLSNLYAWDIDDDPEADVLRGLKIKGGKNKLTVSGNDGTPSAASFAAADTAARLMDGNHFAEMSGRAASAMMRDGVPAVTDKATVQSLLPGKKIRYWGKHPWHTDPEQYKKGKIEAAKAMQYGPNGEYDGWYERSVCGHDGCVKMIFGNIKG